MYKYPLYRTRRIINKTGVSITYRRVTPTYDPVQQLVTSSTNADTVLKALILTGDEESFENKASIVEGTLDVVVSCLDLTITPAPGDFVIFVGTQYRVTHILPGYDGPQLTSYNISAVA